MAKQSRINFNLDGLDDLKKSLSGFHTEIGILGDGNMREGGKAGNAEIGLIHEFGSQSKNIPPRSFLRMPIEEKKRELVSSIRKSQTVRAAIDAGDVKAAFKAIGVMAEGIIQEAFSTGGFGKWPEKSELTRRYSKNPGSPLIETTQLRKAIASRVVRS